MPSDFFCNKIDNETDQDKTYLVNIKPLVNPKQVEYGEKTKKNNRDDISSHIRVLPATQVLPKYYLQELSFEFA